VDWCSSPGLLITLKVWGDDILFAAWLYYYPYLLDYPSQRLLIILSCWKLGQDITFAKGGGKPNPVLLAFWDFVVVEDWPSVDEFVPKAAPMLPLVWLEPTEGIPIIFPILLCNDVYYLLLLEQLPALGRRFDIAGVIAPLVLSVFDVPLVGIPLSGGWGYKF
jgi:hypothetical protein